MITPPQPPMSEHDAAFVPPAVRAAAALADKMQADLIAAANPPGNPNGQEPAPAPAPTPAPAPAPAPAPVVVAAPAPAPSPAPQPADELTEQQIDQLLAQPSEGNPELQRLQHAYKSLRGRLKAANDRLQAQPAPAAPLPIPPAPAPVLLQVPEVPEFKLPQEAVDTFGEDLINLMSDMAGHAAAVARADVLKQVAPLLQQVSQSTTSTAQTNAVTYANTALAPYNRTFDSIDTDPQFVAWLALPDAMSGVKRNELFMDAWRKADGSRLVTIMSSYLNEVGNLAATQPASAPAPGAPPAPAAPLKTPLVTLAAPGRGPVATAPVITQPAVETISRRQISEFYARKQRGEFRGKEKEVAETEVAIHQAIAEGRVTD